MDEEEALALLQSRVLFSESSKPEAKGLVEALECIPLAITHAAAYIKTRAPMTTMSSYLELFHERQIRCVSWTTTVSKTCGETTVYGMLLWRPGGYLSRRSRRQSSQLQTCFH